MTPLKTVFAIAFFLSLCQSASAATWAGDWHRQYEKALNPNATLTFTQKNKTTQFVLDANNGANVGQIEGTLKIESDTQATFQDDHTPPCILRFTKTANSIHVEDIDKNCANAGYGGHNVFFNGEFKLKADLPKPPVSLYEREVLPKDIDEKLKTLVGERYPVFLQNLEGVSVETEKNKTIVDGGVSGVYVYMRAIVVYDTNGAIWAATSDTNVKTENDTLYYYTNVTGDKTKVPPEILKWDERFHSQIVFAK